MIRVNYLFFNKLENFIRMQAKLRLCGMKMPIAFVLLFSLSIELLSQVPIGSWESHLPMSNFNWVGETPEKVYGANRYGILAYDRGDHSTMALTKINQLTQTGISCFECHTNTNLCLIGYENGNMDIITPQQNITNQPAILTSNKTGNKQINDVLFTDQYAFLATGIGIIKFDLNNYNIQESTPIEYNGEKQQIHTAHIWQDSLFMATSDFVLKAPLSTLFTFPQPLAISTGDMAPGQISQFFDFGGKLYCVYKTESYREDTLLSYVNGAFTPIPELAGEGIRHVETTDSTMLVTHPDNIKEYDLDFSPLASIFTYGSPGMDANQARYSAYDNQVIVADGFFGGIITSFENQYNSDIFNRSSPTTGLISSLQTRQDILYCMPGGNEYTYLSPMLHVYNDRQWSSHLLKNETYTNTTNANDIAFLDNSTYVASDRGGLYKLNTSYQLTEVYNEYNSPLIDLRPNDSYDYYGVTAIEKDESNNLWILHNKTPNPLKILYTDGTWAQVKFEGYTSPKTADMLLLSNGYLLINLVDIGILVYDANGTPRNLDDDRYTVLTSSPANGNLPSSNVTCFTQDRDGEIWVGTDAGIGVIYNPENIFNPEFEGAQKIIVNQGGYNAYLFETETVEVIEVDGANRKWVGTYGSGLFLISADGLEQIHHFTMENSPLLGDKVLDLAILPTSGELFIASENGLIAYRSDATEPATDLSTPKVFPNPVKPSYNGLIAITNLTDEAYVRITDASGALVYETRSLGGEATWDGNDFHGQRVRSGVYLIFVADAEGAGGTVSKLLFLN